MVIKPVDDFNIGPIGESPVGEIGLPCLVGLVRFEANVGGLGPFAWFGDYQARLFQDSTDGGLSGGMMALFIEVGPD